MTLEELYTIIVIRKKEMRARSYVTSLFRDGADRIIQKVGEEAVEVVIAAKNKKRQQIIEEVADLLFHTWVLLAKYNIKLSDVLIELGRRHRQK